MNYKITDALLQVNSKQSAVVTPYITSTISKLNHIDQLRGLAILLVVFVHVSQTQLHLNLLLATVADFGKVGVQLFFFLSAYTLCLSYTNRNDPSVTNFYIRRFFRIAPLYYTGILIYYIVSGLSALNLSIALSHREYYTVSNILSNIFFVHEVVPASNNTIVPGGWSIGTEMIFYALFPGIYFIYLKVKHVSTIIAIPFLLLLVASVFALVVNHLGGKAFSDPFYYYFIINQLPVFAVGISYFFLEKAGYFPFSKLTCVFLFFVLFTTSFIVMYKLHENKSLSIFIAAISFSFLFRFFKESKLKIPFLSKVGQLSFSIYIFHFLFAVPLAIRIVYLLSNKINTNLVFAICFLTTIILSVVVASISEKLIEMPGINLGKKLIRRRSIRSN